MCHSVIHEAEYMWLTDMWLLVPLVLGYWFAGFVIPYVKSLGTDCKVRQIGKIRAARAAQRAPNAFAAELQKLREEIRSEKGPVA
mmetsp:Transcript_33345/g.72890  ORF Transcript_33345/g.72890 Transcript_33345/m.72890 type:complete len:85 (-) Transcript_33345:667-921(-)|eukprot:CAMPEP_0204254522 /NCGR_PEP_ID=MMETSP0468-20130131/2587_1 /ASSEMBLY_ACC=CAM_ASM_000383 /TAXON_ID=2969 /ORGANISM="Oxyrrhis marina" /LENGTH=84 /DNA_ID=CAMNT_0051228267 /DNA_START=177 /DNA_END=431 /DNA_ORIENTATION=+